jgi:hypothetical protein
MSKCSKYTSIKKLAIECRLKRRERSTARYNLNQGWWKDRAYVAGSVVCLTIGLFGWSVRELGYASRVTVLGFPLSSNQYL